MAQEACIDDKDALPFPAPTNRKTEGTKVLEQYVGTNESGLYRKNQYIHSIAGPNPLGNLESSIAADEP